ncbi:hypothetical protein GCM10007301_06330 [Azorhizobium oxalatiphilum]|uniref:Uncharacterized protein n=1 Tax=Azorhizobium oxalatiphilum TaxID=980631 RepID=A0A917BL41_9HYPH|nr:hypothetical protein GCM10007301_06330 [Azorhizobium oxalatiphilum]
MAPWRRGQVMPQKGREPEDGGDDMVERTAVSKTGDAGGMALESALSPLSLKVIAAPFAAE